VRLPALALLAVSLAAADEIPGWVREVAGRQVPSYPAKVALVTLLSETSVTVEADGRQIRREREAVKVLQRGRRVPAAECFYNPKSGRVREFAAWLLPPSGKPTSFGKNAIVDQSAAASFEEYDEGRLRLIQPAADLQPGTVFAWEAVDEEKPVYADYEHVFQERDPVLLSRFSLSLPPGWVASAAVFNHDGLQPQVSGGTYTWELRELPWMEPETHSPAFYSVVPRLGVNYYPEGASVQGLRPVKSWRRASSWSAGFADPAAAVTPAIAAKAAELTSGLAAELDKIRAIAAFVQKTNYVAVEINLAHGGGYTPHSADQVLARNYGDCKDKATLMRALLRAAGIEAWPVAIFHGDRQYVRPEWPSPSQFNHMIVAVRVSADTKAPTVVDYPKLGRLLIFDPTDPSTPVGDLPEREQGNHALLVAADNGDLITMPLLPPELNRIESTAQAKLNPDGSLSADLERHYFGQPASNLRYTNTLGEHDELRRDLQDALSYRLGGLTLNQFDVTDHLAEDRFDMKMDVSVRQFGQILQNRLLMVSPGALGRRHGYEFPSKPRQFPIELRAEAYHDSVSLEVPAQFKVDELPDPVRLAGPYGSYSAEWKADGSRVRFEQSLEVNDTMAPATDYAKVRQFFEKVESAQNSSVVLVKE